MLQPASRAYSTLDVSRMCQVDPATVARWCDQGRLVCFRTPGGHRRIVKDNLVRFLNSHGMPLPAELGASRPLILAAPSEAGFGKLLRSAAKTYAPVLDVQQAPDLVTALLRLPIDKPELFLLSSKNGAVETLEIIRSIRRNPSTRPIRIGLFGEPAGSEKGRSAARAGAVECLPSPESVAALIKRIAEQFDGKGRRRFRLRRGV
jgi:CheY-like chemotaxis protein